MLQRVPVILAVTAASYGLPLPVQAQRARTGRGNAASGCAGLTHELRAHQRLASQH
jgi:hypothetical protein